MNWRKVQNRLRGARLFALAVLSLLISAPAFAQSTAGSIYGIVTDASGGVIPQAAITVINVQTNETHTAKSDGAGNYVFPALAPGDYTISTKMSGFNSITQTGIRLDANQNVHVNFSLTVGAVTENVVVEAATTLVDTRESQLGSTIDQKRLEELPLNGRNAYDLVQLSPGVTNYSQAQNSQYVGDPVGATFSTNGLRAYENSFYLDGANNTSYYRPGGNYAPNPDALLEYRILTTSFDAEFGSMPGAVVNMVTRSGTNDFHGVLYDYVRNNILNARTEFVTSAATHLRYNQFGGTVGGPVYRNKLFFFFAYQGLRIAQFQISNAASAILPTGPAGNGAGQTAGASPGGERAGDFSTDKNIPKCGPITYPCPGSPGNPNTTPGIIPAAYLDPVVQQILKSIPTPPAFNGTSGGSSAQQIAGAPTSANQYLGRGDYQLNHAHKLSYMYFHEYGTNASPNSGGDPVYGYSGDLLVGDQTNQVGTDTWTITPSMLNNFRAYYSGNHYHAADLFAGQNTFSQLGITIPCAGSPCTQPNVRIPGYISSLGNSGSAPNLFGLTTFGASDTLIWTRGSHSLKIGAALARNKYASNAVGQRAGIYTIAANGWASGNQLADWLLGKATTYNQNNSYPINLHQMSPSVFAQDDWHVSRQLTLNLGLRWELFKPFCGENNTGTFIPNIQSKVVPTAPIGVLFSGDSGVPDGVLQVTWTKFAPRIGFAYDVFGNGRTSVRGSWGIFYSEVPASFYSSLLSPLYNVSVALTDTTSFANPYGSGTDPFPYTVNLKNPTFANGLAFPAYPAYNKAVPYVLEENLTVEHQFAPNWSGSVSYVGNLARKFYSTRDENAPVYSSSCTSSGSTACNTAASYLARRPYKPGGSYVFNAVDEYYPGISSSYDSLQASLTKRFARGFSINANYVWSKDMADGVDPTANPITTFSASDEYNFKADYGKASYDMPHHFVASYLWVSPTVHLWGYAGREILSGWRISGITTISTGTPFNMVSGTDTNYDNYGNDRPNQVADWHLDGGRSRAQKVAEYFNKLAFSPVPVGTATGEGSTQFNLMIGPGRKNTDMSAAKDFIIKGEHRLQFRTDAFNVFNNVNLGNPTAQLNSANDAVINSAAAGRILQLTLKYAF